MRRGAGVRQNAAVAAGLAFTVIAGLWLTNLLGGYLMTAEAPMTMDDGSVMDMGNELGALPRAIVMFLMWWSMMMAMMLPSAMPAIVVFGSIGRRLDPPPHTTSFVAGYAAVWSIFAALAAGLQIVTTSLIPLTDMMAIASRSLGSVLLVAVGLYQFTNLKGAYLVKCQSPFFYLARHWRKGSHGAFHMGLSHGLFCLGCCWMLMLLLFYGGVMDLRWIIGLAVYVAMEKLLPPRIQIRRLAAAGLMVWGAALLVSTWSA